MTGAHLFWAAVAEDSLHVSMVQLGQFSGRYMNMDLLDLPRFECVFATSIHIYIMRFRFCLQGMLYPDWWYRMTLRFQRLNILMQSNGRMKPDRSSLCCQIVQSISLVTSTNSGVLPCNLSLNRSGYEHVYIVAARASGFCTCKKRISIMLVYIYVRDMRSKCIGVHSRS